MRVCDVIVSPVSDCGTAIVSLRAIVGEPISQAAMLLANNIWAATIGCLLAGEWFGGVKLVSFRQGLSPHLMGETQKCQGSAQI